MSTTETIETTENTIIVGCGIIGLSTAFYLSQPPSTTPPSSIYLVESSPQLFASASGYAAGFLARDWFRPLTADLAELSFRLHRELAEKYRGREKWGYAPSTALSLAKGGGDAKPWFGGAPPTRDVPAVDDEGEIPDTRRPEWLRRIEGWQADIIGDGEGTAQVDPLRLCEFLLDKCVIRGVRVLQPATATSIKWTPEGGIEALIIQHTASDLSTQPAQDFLTIPCIRLILTAGAWTARLFATLFPRSSLHLPITSLAGHSLLVRTPYAKPSRASNDDRSQLTSAASTSLIAEKEDSTGNCHAVFTSDDPGEYSPEIFSRLTKYGKVEEIYIAGLNDARLPLPDLATGRKIDDTSIETLKATASQLIRANSSPSSNEKPLEILREGLCFRPVARPDGVPIICRIDDEKLDGSTSRTGSVDRGGGLWVAAGHGPWGISNSLGTGLCLAEMVEGRDTSADVSGLGL